MFTWVPIHRETVCKVLELPEPQKEILAVLREMEQKQLTVIGLNDRGDDTFFPLREIDPLTFLAVFNRVISEQNRRHNWRFLKERWHLSSDVPQDFSGIPTVNNQNSWFFPYSDKRGKQDVERLWQLVRQVAVRTPEQVDGSLFDQCLQIRAVGIRKLTIGMFWINPDQFLPCDEKTRNYGQKKGIHGKPKDYASYCEWVSHMSEAFGEEYPQLSHDAHFWAMREANGDGMPDSETNSADGQRHVSYWWLNANPQVWNFEGLAIGERKTYTSHNDNRNKRQKYRYFHDVKPGDVLVGYVTSPQREIVGICTITKGLHQGERGEQIEFEKRERLKKPVLYETLKSIPELEKAEPLVNNQGSLFKLREKEYEAIRNLIDKTNSAEVPAPKPYTKQAAMQGLFLSEAQFDEAIDALREKKNIVLQGPPGVGKTFLARRLAKALIGSDDPQRIEMIQFHQSYSYEDFIQGFRPTTKGTFELRFGVFHQFCHRAQRDEATDQKYVFVIDEINRGNLSKIFGELMMLVEPDKRGSEFAIPLAYASDSSDKFYIPDNLYLIGTMNTADRSLAMVDYALRRRFRFLKLRPEFASGDFLSYLESNGVPPELVRTIVGRMEALNKVIAADTKNLGPEYEIGHSYFCPRNGEHPGDRWYERIVSHEIVPLIQEYWFDDEKKVDEQRKALLL